MFFLSNSNNGIGENGAKAIADGIKDLKQLSQLTVNLG